MSKRVFYANYSEDAVRHFNLLEEEDSEEKSTSYFAVILQLPNLNFSNTFIKQLQEEFTHPEKDHQPSVLPSTSQKIQKRKKSCWRVVLQFFQIEVSAVSMSSIRWTKTQELFFMKLWNNKQFLLLKQVLFAHSMLELQFWQLQTLSTPSMTHLDLLLKILIFLQLFYLGLILFTWCLISKMRRLTEDQLIISFLSIQISLMMLKISLQMEELQLKYNQQNW